MQTKRCSACKGEKALSEFGNDKTGKYGKRSYCRRCMSEKMAAYYKNNREKSLETSREWRKNNPEKVSAWRKNNPEKVSAWRAAYYESNREKILEKAREWRKDNPEKARARDVRAAKSYSAERSTLAAAWRKNNPEKVKAVSTQHSRGLSDCFVANALRIPLAEVPKDLIALKREQLLTFRAVKQLTTTIKEKQK